MQEKCLILKDVFDTKYLVDPYAGYIRELLYAIEDPSVDVSNMWWEKVRDIILDARGHSIVLDVCDCGISLKTMLYLSHITHTKQCRVIDSTDSVRDSQLRHRYEYDKSEKYKVDKPPINILDLESYLTVLRDQKEVDMYILSTTHPALVTLCMMCLPKVTIYINPKEVFEYMNSLFSQAIDGYNEFFYTYDVDGTTYVLEAIRDGDTITLMEEYNKMDFDSFSQQYIYVPKEYFSRGKEVSEVLIALEKIYTDTKNELRNNDITFLDIIGGLVDG